MARNEQVRIDLEAKDDASKVIGKVADETKALEELSPQIEVSADTDKAERNIEQVSDEARALSRQDTELVIRAKIDAAKADLAALQAELKQTGERADDTARQMDKVGGDPGGGLRTRGNAIADLTGPLGNASSAASDFGGIFDGIGDIAEDVTGKLGLSAAAAGAVSGAVGGLGIAVAAGAALWTFYQQRQEAARRKQEELIKGQRELTKAIREGNVEAATSQFKEMYGDALPAADKLGISTKQLVDYITGVSDVLPGTAAKMRDLNAAADDQAAVLAGTNNAAVNAAAAYENLLFKVADTRQKYQDLNGTEAENSQLNRELAAALGVTERATARLTTAEDRLESQTRSLDDAFGRLHGGLDFERTMLRFHEVVGGALTKVQGDVQLTSDEILDVKQAILDAAEAANLNPIEVRTILDQVTAGDIAGALWNTQQAINRQGPVEIPATIKVLPASAAVAQRIAQGIITGGGSGPRSMPMAGDTINVYQSVPRGYRGDVLADARRAARRSGGLYRRTRR